MRLTATKTYLLAIAAVVAVILALNFTGFCFRELRYLRQDEFVRIAIAHEGRSIKGFDTNEPSRSTMQFLQNDPKCCRIESGLSGLESSFLDRLFGLRITWVRVVYELTDSRIKTSPKDGRFYEAYVGITPCGEVVDTKGTRLTDAEKAAG